MVTAKMVAAGPPFVYAEFTLRGVSHRFTLRGVSHPSHLNRVARSNLASNTKLQDVEHGRRLHAPLVHGRLEQLRQRRAPCSLAAHAVASGRSRQGGRRQGGACQAHGRDIEGRRHPWRHADREHALAEPLRCRHRPQCVGGEQWQEDRASQEPVRTAARRHGVRPGDGMQRMQLCTDSAPATTWKA